MSEAVLALGTNMGNRLENLNTAVRALAKLSGVKIIKTSSIYETEPWGVTDQPNFLNCCLLVETEVSPFVLLGECLGIEASMGRIRTQRFGPRVIDIDILLYENVKVENYELTLPHPRILERAFVMVPLEELFPTGQSLGLFFGPHLRELGRDGVVKIDKEIIVPKYDTEK